MTPLLEFRHVSRSFEVRRGFMGGSRGRLVAVDDVNLTAMRGETLGLVGESGCGKSTLARMAVRLLSPSSGDVLLWPTQLEQAQMAQGEPPVPLILSSPLAAEQEKTLSRRIQMVFQDPFSSLNPRLRVGTSVGEPLQYLSRAERQERVENIFELVGLEPAHIQRYPHEFSGGQRQRLAVARALITRPDFVVCDEAVSALDASVQAQILNLLRDMQDRFGFTYLFISHDLAVVGHMSDRVAVMYLGRVVEVAPREALFCEPAHPYTRALLLAAPSQKRAFLEVAPSQKRAFLEVAPSQNSAFLEVAPSQNSAFLEVAPSQNSAFLEVAPSQSSASLEAAPSQNCSRRKEHRFLLAGELPSPLNPPSGCAFHPRCPDVMPRCKEVAPSLTELDACRSVRCHLYS